jgi:hypothetical protein
MYVDTGRRRSEAATLASPYRGILTTRSVLDTTGPAWAVPAGILAVLLD